MWSSGSFHMTSTTRLSSGHTEPVRSVVLHAFTNALDDVFLVGVPFVAVAIVVALLLKEEPLRTGQP